MPTTKQLFAQWEINNEFGNVSDKGSEHFEDWYGQEVYAKMTRGEIKEKYVMKGIADSLKTYSISYKYDIIELDTPAFHGMAHGYNKEDAEQLFMSRNPGVIILDVEEIKLK